MLRLEPPGSGPRGVWVYGRTQLTNVDTVARLIEPEVQALGYELVRVAMIGGPADRTLQVMAERADTRQLDLGDCEKISRRLSEVFDALEADGRDPIDGSYRLEVSSPGIDRPLTPLKDYRDWVGYEARIGLAEVKGRRKQHSRTLEGLERDTLKLPAKDGNTYHIAFADIRSVTLLLNDKHIQVTA